MFGWFKKRKKELSNEEIEQIEEQWHEEKDAIMKKILGDEYGIVSHAILPYAIGGALDLYYYPHGVDGTGVATKELALACEESPNNVAYSQYELVMFTRHKIDITLEQSDEKDAEETSFGKAERNIRSILNLIARYSADATLNPGNTCEFPEEMEYVGGKCLIFDCYKPNGCGENEHDFGIMLIMEIFPDEMEFVRANGSEALFKKFKEKGIYPYSDLDRASALNA